MGVVKVRTRRSKEERIQALRRGIDNNRIKTLEGLCKRVGLEPSGVYSLSQEEGITIPERMGSYGWRPDIDSLIQQGLKLREMGDALKREGRGITGAAVGMYIHQSRQEKIWKRKKKERYEGKLKEKMHAAALRRQFFSLLAGHVAQEFRDLSWAQQKAQQYRASLKVVGKNTYPLDKLTLLFQTYRTAEECGKKLSLEELGKEVSIHFVAVRMILKRVGVEPMYGTHLTLPRDTRRRVVSGLEKRVPTADIAYFLNVPLTAVDQIYSKCFRSNHPKLCGPGGKNGSLSYKVVSEIYEAKDAGYLINDIAQLVEKSVPTVQGVLKVRSDLEPKVVGALRVLYGDESIKKPYVKMPSKN